MDAEMDLVERDLEVLRMGAVYPATPDLVAGFWEGLARDERPSMERMIAPALVAAAAVVVLSAFMVSTIVPVRDAAAGLLNRIDVFSTNEPVAGLPEGVSGEGTTLEEAGAALGRPIETPAYPPDASLDNVLMQDFGPAVGAVSFYTAPNFPQFAVFVTNANVGKAVAVDSGVSAEPVSWPGVANAYWFDGPHRLEYRSFEGDVLAGSVRRTGENTLVWERNGFVYRIEGALERDEAIRVAQSLQ